ncbi:hypothetical protein LPBF_05860 [Flavobacterium crassostreae]|uniref:Glycosyl transferase family 1 domain-containing protein n=2 Tax=Flavobacterium crassostreae TaxID=1763534 RepID=A0A1B9E3D4_9FLAO|nr:hypothetical protein LPBF_05860 [Flavobacterium crassostreae]
MTQKKVYKIALISEQLASGGAERCAALLSQFFESKNIVVHHVIVIDKVTYAFSGTLLNLGLYKNKSNGILNKLQRLCIFKEYVQNNSLDFIIDFRVKNNPFQEFIIAKYVYKAPYIVTVHSYCTDWYFPKWSFLAKKIYTNAYGIVSVSQKIAQKITGKYHYKNTEVIYNPIAIAEIQVLSEEPVTLKWDYVLGIGRMDDGVKQLDKLIAAYAKSVLPSKNIKLVLLGEGLLRKALELQAHQLDLADKVVFLGWKENPFKYMKQAKYTVLSSKNEGFGTVLIESLACKTPVISFDCLSGPSEIIKNNYNGLLVENQNVDKLAQAMNLMIEDTTLYQFCKQNALESVRRFSLETIGNKWLEYLKINVS